MRTGLKSAFLKFFGVICLFTTFCYILLYLRLEFGTDLSLNIKHFGSPALLKHLLGYRI